MRTIEGLALPLGKERIEVLRRGVLDCASLCTVVNGGRSSLCTARATHRRTLGSPEASTSETRFFLDLPELVLPVGDALVLVAPLLLDLRPSRSDHLVCHVEVGSSGEVELAKLKGRSRGGGDGVGHGKLDLATDAEQAQSFATLKSKRFVCSVPVADLWRDEMSSGAVVSS